MSVLSFLSLRLEINLQILNNTLTLQIPDLNTILRGSTEPVPIRAEAKRVDNRTRVERVEPLPLSQIPEQDHPIFPTTRAEGPIRRDRHGVHIPTMAGERAPQLAVGEVPDLDRTVPRGRDNSGLERVGAEPHAADPVPMGLAVGDGVLALAESVPELDRAVPRGRDDLTVVDGEGDGEDVLGVANESAGGDAGGEVPEAKLAVPGAGEGELAVGGEDDVLDEVGVAGEAAAGDSVGLLVLGELPEDDGLVAGGGDDHVGVVDGGGDGGDHVGVGPHGATENESLGGHCCFWCFGFGGASLAALF